MWLILLQFFFFETLEGLNTRYGGLFEGELGEDEQQPRRNKGGFDKYGWTITIEHLVKELGLTPKEVYDMHVHEFLYWCIYYKDKRIETERQQQLSNMRNR